MLCRERVVSHKSGHCLDASDDSLVLLKHSELLCFDWQIGDDDANRAELQGCMKDEFQILPNTQDTLAALHKTPIIAFITLYP